MSSFVYNNTRFKIVDKGGLKYQSSFGQEGGRLNITYRVPWKDRKAARIALLGGVAFRTVAGGTGPGMTGYFNRKLPHASIEGDGWLFCTQVDPDPEITLDPDDEYPNAQYATLRCVYAGLPYECVADSDVNVLGTEVPVIGVPDESRLKRYVSLMPVKDMDRVLQAKGSGWRFQITLTTLRQGLFIPIQQMEKVYCWHQIPYDNIPWAYIKSCKHKSNNAVFDGADIGTLIFKKYNLETVRLPDGTRAVNLFYHFEYTANGANFFPDPDRGYDYYPVESTSIPGRLPYPLVNFANLFRPVVPPLP